jgi:hypothetical protein
LQLLGLSAAVVVAPEPVRRYWFFGLDKSFYSPAANTLFQNQALAQGTIKLSDGTVVHVSDFKESDKYDTILVPQYSGGKIAGVASRAVAGHPRKWERLYITKGLR